MPAQGRRKPRCKAMAPPCEKPAKRMFSAAMPRAVSSSYNACNCAKLAAMPALSSWRRSKLMMSYQARMGMPWLMVMARTGACGKSTRVCAASPSMGTTGAKSWPSAPKPCSQMMLCVASLRAGTVIRSRACVIISLLHEVGIMRHTLSLLLLASMFLSACGQKGPLYLPENTDDTQSTESAA